jgi:hypothetical protein
VIWFATGILTIVALGFFWQGNARLRHHRHWTPARGVVVDMRGRWSRSYTPGSGSARPHARAPAGVFVSERARELDDDQAGAQRSRDYWENR